MDSVELVIDLPMGATMPRKVHPDWRVIVSKAEVRKAVISGRGLDKLSSWEKKVAPSLHAYLSKDKNGKPLPSEKQLELRDQLAWRQFAAAKRILAAHLWNTIKDFKFQLVSGHEVSFLVAFGPTQVYEAIKDLNLGIHAHHFTDEILANRPDVAIRLLERWAAEAEAVADNPDSFQSAREEFAASAARHRAKIDELSQQQPYLGRGRRRRLDPDRVRQFVDELADWLTAHPEVLQATSRDRSGAVTDVINQVQELGLSTGNTVERALPGPVSAILFEGRARPARSLAAHLVAVAIGAHYDSVRKLG